jgi:hypothetical protein
MSKGFKNFRIVSDAFARPTNTTAYAAGDSVCPASKTITAASNASPIVITSTAHGYVTGDRVTIASVGGNTNANADWVVTRIDADTFSLDGSTGNSAYTSGGTATRLLRLASALPANQTRGRIVKTKLMCNLATVTNGTFRVYFFTAQISQIADNAAWTLLYTNRAALIGYTAALTLVTEGSGSDAAIAQDVASEIPLIASSEHLYAVIVAEGAYTPSSGETFYLEVTIEEV